MFILFGWGKRTFDHLGSAGTHLCPNCSNLAQWSFVRIRTWFALFFIPVFPYKTLYMNMCPVCKHGLETDGEAQSRLLKLASVEAEMAQSRLLKLESEEAEIGLPTDHEYDQLLPNDDEYEEPS